ncbi:hypothetical protein [Aquicoccus sp. SU-CL01552]|uniref:hypothetical protein n=1 Tax=Aquicoccus sp. SU-CL01552 TaxID=3127656 RepID=UPI0031062016
MNGPWIEVFGYGLAVLALATSLGMIAMGRRWQKVEARAYGGVRRPKWFLGATLCLGGLWILAAFDFARSEQTIAGWALIAGVPLVWSMKAALIVFNPKGRKAVTAIDTDAGWRKIGLARLPIALVLVILTVFS